MNRANFSLERQRCLRQNLRVRSSDVYQLVTPLDQRANLSSREEDRIGEGVQGKGTERRERQVLRVRFSATECRAMPAPRFKTQ